MVVAERYLIRPGLAVRLGYVEQQHRLAGLLVALLEIEDRRAPLALVEVRDPARVESARVGRLRLRGGLRPRGARHRQHPHHHSNYPQPHGIPSVPWRPLSYRLP